VDLPDNWQYVSVGGMNIPPNVRQKENLEFSWIDNQVEDNTIFF
jgi:hypothetical protein